jgi:GntR family transcriptional repressor for pyruvate dehydrogenase complex
VTPARTAALPAARRVSVRRPRAFQRIVDEIRSDVFGRRISAGDRLPGEDHLAERFEVSRPAVREALRVLELQGLVRVEHGFHGGAFVADSGAGPAIDALETMLRLEHLDRAEIYAARRHLEPAVAALAAVRLEDATASALDANLIESERRIASGKPAFGTNLAFHDIVAAACGNRLLSLMTRAVLELLRGVEARRPSDERVNREAWRAHTTILRALREGDGDAAASEMSAHLERVAHHYGTARTGKGRP